MLSLNYNGQWNLFGVTRVACSSNLTSVARLSILLSTREFLSFRLIQYIRGQFIRSFDVQSIQRVDPGA